MATKFTSIVDKGSPLRMTVVGWMIFIPVALVTLFLLRNAKLYNLIALPIEWVIISILFTSHPQRVIAKFLYLGRTPRIVALRDESASQWADKSEDLLKKVGVEIYKGE